MIMCSNFKIYSKWLMRKLYIKNVEYFARGIYKFQYGLSPSIMNDIFKAKCNIYNLTGRTNIQKFETGMSTGRLRDPVSGRPADQMIGRSRDFRGTSVKHVF